MKQILLLLFLVPISFYGHSATLRGKVNTTSGAPIPYATIYIHENTLGIIANEQGEFQATLPNGSFTVEARSIGFETQFKTISIAGQNLDLSFSLAEKSQALKEITVQPGKEDPAYEIMRRAIASAPRHLYQVQTFHSENYLKGSVKIEKVPGLITMMIKDKKLKSLIGQLLVLESQNNISFRSPSRYTQQVVAYKSSVPKEMEPKGGGIRVITSNIYDQKFDGYVSPLSPQAFYYYKFNYIESFSSGRYQVNQIRVTPKISNAPLYSGSIYIIDNDWGVFSVDLSVTETGTTERYKIQYQEVKPGIFMPINYSMYANIGTMGVKGYARFFSSVKYKDITLNPAAARRSASLATTPTLPAIEPESKSKDENKMEQLLTKPKLSRKNALLIAKLAARSLEPQEKKTANESLQINDSSNIKFTVDTLAAKRDSAYWEAVRNVPLLADEHASFLRIDTLPPSTAVKTTDNSIEISAGTSSGKKRPWLWGNTLTLGKNAWLSYNGLLRGMVREYNFVDGFWLGQKLNLNINTSQNTKLSISPWIYYATARKVANWNTELKFSYLPLSNGQLTLSGGNSSADIQGDKGTSRPLNALASLFTGDNAIRFYQNQSITLENRVDLANGLFFTAGMAYEKRTLLQNTTSFHLFGHAPHPNAPDPDYISAFPINTSTAAWGKLEYTPRLKFRLKDGHKQYTESVYPTLVMYYKSAFRTANTAEQANYSLLKFGIGQQIKTDEWSHFTYYASAGTFLSRKQLYAPDGQYFQTSPLMLTFEDLNKSFALLNNYTNSTHSWAETHLSLNSKYLLLKRIPFLQRYMFNESLHFNALYTSKPDKLYTEAGYSLGLGNAMRVGVFTSFQGKQYQSTGLRISIPINW